MPNKALAAGGSTAVAGAITTLLLAIFWPHATPDISGAIQTVITAVLSGLATYFVPHGSGP